MNSSLLIDFPDDTIQFMAFSGRADDKGYCEEPAGTSLSIWGLKLPPHVTTFVHVYIDHKYRYKKWQTLKGGAFKTHL